MKKSENVNTSPQHSEPVNVLPTNLDEDIDDLMYLYKVAENDEVRDDAKARMKRLVQSICLSVIPEETVAVEFDEEYDHNDGKKHAIPEYALGWNDCLTEVKLSIKEKIDG